MIEGKEKRNPNSLSLSPSLQLRMMQSEKRIKRGGKMIDGTDEGEMVIQMITEQKSEGKTKKMATLSKKEEEEEGYL